MSAPVAVAAFGSGRVHAATERNVFGQYEPLCGGVKPWSAASTDAPINCPRCLKALATT